METYLIERRERMSALIKGQTVVGRILGRKILFNNADMYDIAADVAGLFDCNGTCGLYLAQAILNECGFTDLSKAIHAMIDDRDGLFVVGAQ